MRTLTHILKMIIAVVVLSGCIPAYKISQPPPIEPPTFVLVDKRKDIDKEGSRSRLISSCDYGIARLGEDEINPPRMEVLKRRLQAEKAVQEKLKGKTIEVDSFKIIRNWQMSLRKNVGSRYSGAVAETLIYGCIAGPEIEGSYLPSENPKHLPSFTIILSARISEQNYNVRYFETANSLNETVSGREENILHRVLNNAMGKFVQQIEARN